MPDEVPLSGGIANAGLVVRVGDTVRRPWQPASPWTAAVLARLAQRAPGVAPEPLGRDEQGREVLSWVEGDVALPPYPEWAVGDAFLVSVGMLLRRVHDALAGWLPADGHWSGELADPASSALVVHADVCPENVVARGGRAVALLDWDFAAPGRAVWDVVSTARLCGPLVAPLRRPPEYGDADQLARLRLLADAYGLDEAQRREVPAVLEQRRAAGRAFVLGRALQGSTGFAWWLTPAGQAALEADAAFAATVGPRVLAALLDR